MKLLLIGVGPGIGMATARRFGREGFEVLMIARDEDKLAGFQQELAGLGVPSLGYSVDIADATGFAALMGQLAAEHPDVDILHYNASAYNPALPSAMDLAVFQTDLHINITGALVAAQAILPAMKRRGRGTLFLTGGSSAFDAPAELFSLSIGKAGMRRLALSLAEECAPLGIQVATVTIGGMVQPGTKYDPVLIADEFWRLYQLPREKWEQEVSI